MSASDIKLPDGWVIRIDNEGSSPIRYVEKSGTEQVPAFKLNDTAYHDVQNYVFAGMSLPKDEAEFGRLIPRDQIQELNALDEKAWQNMMDAITDVQNHCFDFNASGMSLWRITATNVITYARYAIDQISGRDNLTQSLAIMVDPKYRDVSSHDQDYSDAAEVCQAICEDLMKQATKYEASTNDMVTKLEAFQNLTIIDKGKIDALQTSFEGRDGKDGWSAALNAELASLRQDVVNKTKEVKDSQKELEDDSIIVGTTACYIWMFPAGTIAALATLSEYYPRAIAARDRYQEAEKQILRDGEGIKHLLICMNYISAMSTTTHDLDRKMGLAVAAMTEIKNLFTKQSESLGLIAASMSSAELSFHRSFAVRKRVLAEFEEASEQWRTVEDLANKFIKSGSPVIIDVDKSTSAGNFAPSNAATAA